MRTVTWQQLEPHTVEYANVNIGRLTRSVLNVTRDSASDRTSAQRWLCHSTPYSVLGLDYISRNSPTIRATMLAEPTNLVLGIDFVRALPAGTDVRAVYSDAKPQFVTFDLPDAQLGVRAVPPYCARVHNGEPLVPKVADPAALFTPDGQMGLLCTMRELAVAAGSNSHVADIDQRLLLLVNMQTAGQRRLAS